MRGAWTNLNPRHDRAALARSALEGVAIAIKNAYAHLPATDPSRSVLLAGGGTAASGWRQMLADALGRPLDAVQVSAASAMGAALLGGSSWWDEKLGSPRTRGSSTWPVGSTLTTATGRSTTLAV